MRVIVAGATGFLGLPLCGELLRGGHSVTAVSRDPHRAARVLPRDVHCAGWSVDEVRAAVADADCVVNLSGESINAARWTPRVKERIRISRIDATRKLVDAIRAASRTGQSLVNASAIGYYGDRGSAELTEDSPPGKGFLAELCVQWEEEARRAEGAGARVAIARIAPALAEDGGMLEKLLPIFRLGLGGPLGSGHQWMSWIHRADAVRMLAWMVENQQVHGPVNVTAPEPVTMRTFAGALGRALRRPAVLSAPPFALRLVLGEFAESVLAGQRVLPRVAEKLGFRWTYPTLKSALRTILGTGEEDE